MDHRGLGKAQRTEACNDVRLGAGSVYPAGKAPAQHLRKRVDVIAPRQHEDVHGLLIFRTGGEQRGRRDFAHRGGDVGVPQVVLKRRDQRRPVRPQVAVGVGVVEFAGHDRVAVVVEFQRVLPVRDQNDVRVIVLLQLAGHTQGDVVVAHEHGVSVGVRRQNPGLAAVVVLLDPRLVHEPDKGERHQNHDEDDPRHQHDDGKQLPHVAREGDVPETERGHDRQRPVDAGDVGVVPALIGHDLVEKDAEHRHQKGRKEQEAQHDAPVAASGRLGQQRRKKRQKELHG